MSKVSPQRGHGHTMSVPFHSVRHISSPEDLANNRRVYSGHMPIQSVLELPTDENVRDYLLDAEGKKRLRPTQVHRAIRDTLVNRPEDFSVLNGGVVIVARDLEIDEQSKALKLLHPSIINGSQTRGVIRDFLKEANGEGNGPTPIHVKFEVVVTDDDDLIAEISIARNFQDDVASISIVGRRGQLEDLQKSLQKKRPGAKLQKSETELSDDYLKTERLLQVIAALIPEELWVKDGELNKVYTYSQKAKCLKDFQEIYRVAHDPNAADHQRYLRLYQFYLDIAAEADDLYNKWKEHQGFKGTGIRALKRDKTGRILEVPDGIVFPILAALSVFAKQTSKGWIIAVPDILNDDELVQTAKRAYMEIADSNPNKMGKTKPCYSALMQITSIYKKLSH